MEKEKLQNYYFHLFRGQMGRLCGPEVAPMLVV